MHLIPISQVPLLGRMLHIPYISWAGSSRVKYLLPPSPFCF
jgi:hypothetical protein